MTCLYAYAKGRQTSIISVTLRLDAAGRTQVEITSEPQIVFQDGPVDASTVTRWCRTWGVELIDNRNPDPPRVAAERKLYEIERG